MSRRNTFLSLAALAALVGAPALADNVTKAPISAHTGANLAFATEEGDNSALLLNRFATTSGALAPQTRVQMPATRNASGQDTILSAPFMQSRPRIATLGETPGVAVSRNGSRLEVGNYWAIGAFR